MAKDVCDDLIGDGADFHPGRGAYAASKYALEARSDALRMELRHTGIKVSLIEPGPIRTRFTDNVNQTQRDKPVENPASPHVSPAILTR